jgi:hypothetical protein
MTRYTTKEVQKLFTTEEKELDRSTLLKYKNGVNSRRNGRVEWTAPPILADTDYEIVIENGRAKTYYFDSAIEKIRAEREKAL